MSLINCSVRTDEGALNRLSKAGSPYLREHADNPVDWYEWGPEALDKAKKENKPLIISIGYASCHWCHVMERESFMDTAVARIMNENFVSIKVDREERPDIDQIYLEAAQLISGNGGWPLNAFALPDGKPFYAATYFPKEQWVTLLGQVRDAYVKDNENVVRQAEALTKGIRSTDAFGPPAHEAELEQSKYDSIFLAWQSYFDFKRGGISPAPKFPMPVVGEFLLQYHYLTGNKRALDAATASLDAMASGGIFDQLGGGFSRYSTDAIWHVPHFEKMLYDNGQLVSLYSHAYQVTHNELYAEVIERTLEFIEREMTSSEGAFYSSLNADSEGEEGKFYSWTKKEIQNILDAKSADLFNQFYQVTDSGNWENGVNVLFPRKTKDQFATEQKITPEECKRILSGAEKVVMEARNKRIRPSLDDKVIVSWNALMLKGYVDAYAALGKPEHLQKALTNASFIEKNMMKEDGSLLRTYKDGKASIDGFLDDYALLSNAFIQLYQATFDVHWLDKATSITKYAIARFYDHERGLFYYTSDKSENLIARKMELADNVIAASNSAMAEVTYLIGEYYAVDSLKSISSVALGQVAGEMNTSGPYYANWARVMGMISYGPYEVAVMGEQAVERSQQMRRSYNPTALFMGGNSENLPLLENKLVQGRTIIYVCRDKICKLPVEDVEQAMKQIK